MQFVKLKKKEDYKSESALQNNDSNKKKSLVKGKIHEISSNNMRMKTGKVIKKSMVKPFKQNLAKRKENPPQPMNMDQHVKRSIESL